MTQVYSSDEVILNHHSNARSNQTLNLSDHQVVNIITASTDNVVTSGAEQIVFPIHELTSGQH